MRIKASFLNLQHLLINVNKWTTKDDIIQIFINDLCDEGFFIGELPLKLQVGTDFKISKPKIWNAFNIWQEEGLCRNEQIGRNKFYQMLEVKGFPIKKLRDNNYFIGLGESENEASEKI